MIVHGGNAQTMSSCMTLCSRNIPLLQVRSRKVIAAQAQTSRVDAHLNGVEDRSRVISD